MCYNIYFCWHVFLKESDNETLNSFYHLKPLIMNSGSKVLLGVLAGAATGAILGVLFAPEAGTETRRRLGEGSRDVANNLKDKFSEFVDGIAEKYENAKESASNLVDQGRQKASDLASNLTGSGGGTTGSTGSTGAGGGTGTTGTGGATGGNGGANRPSFQ
jgi:gas vesicle protein